MHKFSHDVDPLQCIKQFVDEPRKFNYQSYHTQMLMLEINITDVRNAGR